LPLLKRLHVRAVSLANNHSFDFGRDCHRKMAQMLQAAGIVTLENRAVHDFRNFRLAALTDVDNRAPQKAALLRSADLRGLTKAGRDKPLFAFIHWGQEYASAPGPRQEVLSAALEGKGVELIIGSHSHRAGSLVCRRQGCLAFSLGNFIFDQNRPEVSGALLEAIFFPQGTYFLRWHPLGNLYLL
jgi:poly-gamma-glutamate capsule biosynthesis protein CapA/YwtB (metallophosphatase superfamily)